MRILPIAISVLLLAACGSESPKDTSSTAPASSTEQAQAPAAKKRVEYYVISER